MIMMLIFCDESSHTMKKKISSFITE